MSDSVNNNFHNKNYDSDILQELSQNKIDYLCNQVLRDNLPECIHVYNFIKTMSSWQKAGSGVEIRLTGVNNDVSDGTFVGITYLASGSAVVVVYAAQDPSRLCRALAETRRIPWEKVPLFEAVLERFVEPMQRALEVVGVQASVYSVSGSYYIDAQVASELDPLAKYGDDVSIRPLTIEDLEYIYSVWAHKDIYSLKELQSTLRMNFGVGVWLRECTEGPVAWCMQTHYGGTGVLQTRQGFTRRGFGSIAAAAVSKQLGQLGQAPHANIMDTNFKSRALFEKLGFVRVASIRYMTARPIDILQLSTEDTDQLIAT